MTLNSQFLLAYLLSFSTLPILITQLLGLRFVGLTGGISTGKSSVTRILRLWGVPVIDFDMISRKVVEPGSSLLPRLAAAFGNDVIASDGSLDRTRLGEVIFGNAEKRRKLNSMMQAPIFLEFLKQALQLTVRADPEIARNIAMSGVDMGLRNILGGHKVIVLDIPLLFEAGFDMLCWQTVFVGCSDDIQLRRLMSRDKLTQEQAEQKIAAQMRNGEKAKRATRIIDNNGDMIALAESVKFWWGHTLDDMGINGGFSSFVVPTVGSTILSACIFVLVTAGVLVASFFR